VKAKEPQAHFMRKERSEQERVLNSIPHYLSSEPLNTNKLYFPGNRDVSKSEWTGGQDFNQYY